MNIKSIVKKIGEDYKCNNGLLSLPASYVTDDVDNYDGLSTKEHSSGWTISGEVVTDWFQWVTKFTAKHDYYGTVKGDFNKKIKATSEEGFAHFIKHHPFDDWDIQGI